MKTNRIFIRYIFIAIVLLFTINISKAQFTITPSDTVEIYQDFNIIDYYKVNINNTSSDTLHMHWTYVRYDTIAGTYFDFCASGICYTGWPLTGSFPLIPPGSFGWAGAHFLTGSIPATSVGRVLLTNGNSTTGVVVTFILHAVNTACIENKQLSEDLISIYPNPAKDKITVKLDLNATNETSISLNNVIGELVYSNTTKNSLTDISLKEIGAGIYFLTIISGNKKFVKKIIVSGK